MNLQQRLHAFATLGAYIRGLDGPILQDLYDKAKNENAWFREESLKMALDGISGWLTDKSLSQWVSAYPEPRCSRKIAIVMAGNIPLVGFHDLLAVLISGHSAVVKLSSKDQYLPTLLIEKLIAIEPAFETRITLVDQLKSFDAVIATGSDNSARYFDFYFNKYPSIIRRNRTSVGILTGAENTTEMEALGHDIFSYYGLGCRNVSKILVPENFVLDPLIASWEGFSSIINHHKYANNYDYQKSILLINREPFLDNGFLLLRKTDKIVSPISVLYYDYYKSERELRSKLELLADKVQIVVGSHSPLATIPFGRAQSPGLMDYADHVDTMKFLCGLE